MEVKIMQNERIRQVERYAWQVMEEQLVGDLGLAHNYAHVDRGGPLGATLRDADILDLLGAVGIMRGCTSMHQWQEYDPAQVKGETWGITAAGITARFQAGLGTGPTIVDHLNFQISCYENLHTEAARRWGRLLAEYMRTFILQLEQEVLSGQITDEFSEKTQGYGGVE
jgi:hypothetical protein